MKMYISDTLIDLEITKGNIFADGMKNQRTELHKLKAKLEMAQKTIRNMDAENRRLKRELQETLSK